ncbi:MAG: hypothetical protein PVF68_00725 [Acidobacteriota bacterium]|jgi:mevalonate kinase
MAATSVSVPGKLILMGEHAVVYGRPAILAALDLRLRARAEDRDGPGVHLDLPGLGLDRTVSWEAVRDHAAAARGRWERFRESPTAARFQQVRGDDPAHLALVALGEAAAFEAEWDACAEPGLHLSIESAIPVGSGFGSSAAAAVAIVAAYRRLRGRSLDGRTLDRVVLEVERRQHGLPSGADHAAVLAGGVLWARKEGGTLTVRPLDPPPGPLSRLRIYDSGPPAESTGEVVAAVSARRAADRQGQYAILDRMESATEAFRDQLIRDDEHPPVLIAILREYETCLEELGVVPEAVREAFRDLEAAGAAAKISGAGALTGSGAGGVILYGPHGDASRISVPAGWRHHAARLGAPGLRWERE